jgi:small-conductance mechanosensitive channel
MKEQLLQIWGIVLNVWNFMVLEFEHQSITIKKIIIAITIIMFGFYISKKIGHIIGKKLLAYKKIDENTVSVVEKIIHYFLLITFVFLALRMVHIPLTTFAFLGGALIVGIGFGTKNLINNFISGFILMIEHPIKIGDVIEVVDKKGVVQKIGARATHVLTAKNEHIIIPNSFFLENNLVNWTLSDNEVRSGVKVGIAYESDIHKATKLMIEAVENIEGVLKEPKPFVMFQDFADSTLVFEVFFRVKVKNTVQRYIKESDVRYSLNDALTKNGIVIAFPQADIHLDTKNPIDVKINN